MSWHGWIKCKFDDQGELDTSPLRDVPNEAGIYAIATETLWSYQTHYIGRSGRSMRERLQRHLNGKGNHVIAGVLANKRKTPSDPTAALFVAFFPTREHKLVEAAFIDAEDRPLGNLIRARLPQGLREEDVFGSEKED
jgi:hypothetical protein